MKNNWKHHRNDLPFYNNICNFVPDFFTSLYDTETYSFLRSIFTGKGFQLDIEIVLRLTYMFSLQKLDTWSRPIFPRN